MLLIFFLVTTSMDSDKGLHRQLPPKNVEKEVVATDVDRNTVMTIGITADNRYTYSLPGQLEPAPCTDAELRKQLNVFIPRLGDKHIIEIQASRNACYDRYFHLQNILVHVYRDDLKRKYKQRISENYVP
ncbi:MAG: biopolymer transporter ExbD [Bacteroidales bacterium]|nr:biopolymer transporter ExbD [Bacteroidales bacterium]MCM1147497.1 biopolymer transporter ExbD [Bacteroidales bacterium]MCM1206166.1 biopolymer transporter ExbD [Bacillota bacterium]MCM1510002.1 biopolymer transporter ExbD [Clostridium sp.]